MSLGHVDLNLLVTLDALLTERSVTRAAERLGVSQPAMSMALRRLRAMFKDDLLIRSGRENQLTPLAEGLVEQVREIMRLVEEAIEYRPDFEPSIDNRTFRIAATEQAEYMLLGPLIQRMLEETPGLSLEIETTVGQFTIEGLETGDIDLGIWPLDRFDCSLIKEPLYEDRFMCAVWSGARGIEEILSSEEFGALPYATYNFSWYERRGLRPPEIDWPEEPRLRFSDSHPFVRLFLLRGTNMVTLIPEQLGRRVAEAADIRLLEPPFPCRSLRGCSITSGTRETRRIAGCGASCRR